MKNSHFEQTVVACIPIVLLVYEGHPFWNFECVSIEMLENQNMVMMNEQFRIYYDLVQMCHIKGFELQIRAKNMDGEMPYKILQTKNRCGGLSCIFTNNSPRFHFQVVKEFCHFHIHTN